jgi:hypothetical protein
MGSQIGFDMSHYELFSIATQGAVIFFALGLGGLAWRFVILMMKRGFRAVHRLPQWHLRTGIFYLLCLTVSVVLYFFAMGQMTYLNLISCIQVQRSAYFLWPTFIALSNLLEFIAIRIIMKEPEPRHAVWPPKRLDAKYW